MKAAAPRITQDVEGPVSRRLPEPAGGSGLLPQWWPAPGQLQEQLLRQILGVLGAARHAVHQAIDAAEVLAEETVELRITRFFSWRWARFEQHCVADLAHFPPQHTAPTGANL